MRELSKETKEIAREVISECFDVELIKVTDEALLTNDLGADSLDILEVVVDLEKKFSISIDDDAVSNYRNLKVSDLFDVLSGYIN